MSDGRRLSDRRARKRLSEEEIAALLDDSSPEDFSSGSSDNFEASAESEESSSDSEVSGGQTRDESADEQSEDVDGDVGDGGDMSVGGGDGSGDGNTYQWVDGEGGIGLNNNFTCTEVEEIHLVNSAKPISQLTVPEVYQLIVTDEIIDYMVDCTNENANKYLQNHTMRRSSRFRFWHDTNRDEMKEFMGLRFYMGLVKMPSIRSYWSESTVYSNKVAPNAMSARRFLLILRFWHFGPNDQSAGRLHKIQPLIDKLQKQYTDLKTPGKDLVGDESMIPFRRRLKFRQYLPLKRHKYGIKVFELCDPKAYTYRIKLYQGRGSHDTAQNMSAATQVVLDLAEPYLDCGRIICTDNYYTSMELLKALQERRTHLIGTLRKNRKNLPKAVMAAKLKKDQSKFATEQTTGAIALKWRDKRDVHMLSSVYSAEDKPTKSRRGKEVTKPEIVIEYNRMKGGIDIADTLLSYHNPQRKSIRWYHKVADRFLFGTSVINAFLIWNETRAPGERKMSIEHFRKLIVEIFLRIPSVPVRERTAAKTTHYLRTQEDKDKTGRPRRSRCRGCYSKLAKTMNAKDAKNQAKKVQTICSTCEDKPYYCMACFEEAHKD